MVLELKNDYLTVQFSDFGAQLTSIKDTDGVEYLWQPDPTYWTGQAPVLFPICGSIRNDLTIYKPAERPYFTGNIPRHGLVRKQVFQVEEKTENTIIFVIGSTEEMLKSYPYPFELRIKYTLFKKTIRTEYQVKNTGSQKQMPYFIGGHPGFNCPLLEGDKYEDFYVEFEQEETCSVPKSFPDTGLLDLFDRTPFLNKQKTLELSYDLFSHDAVTLDELQSRKITLRSHKHSKGVEIDFEYFPYLILWSTTNRSPFIALEPWSGLSTSLEESDYFEEKRNVTFVSPGQISIKKFDITIL